MAADANSEVEQWWIRWAQEHVRTVDVGAEPVSLPSSIAQEEARKCVLENVPAPAALSPKCFNTCPPEAVELVRASFETLLNDREADWPRSWCQCHAVLLPKKAKADSFAQLRPIMLFGH